MTIKVGQVYKYTAEPSTRFVVTAAFDENTRFDYILNDGVVFSYEKGKDLLDGTELIAEYSTWIEAVNSKEFKNDII